MADHYPLPDTTRIYHNPHCSKSRQALALLEERGVKPEVVRYLETPPGADELAGLVSAMGCQVRDIIRIKESEYKELGLDNEALSEQQLLAALSRQPGLIERPIVVHGGRVVIGRPPEKVLELL